MGGSIVFTVAFVHGLIMPDYRYQVLCGLEIASTLIGKNMNAKVRPKILHDHHVFGPSIKDKTGKKKDVEAAKISRQMALKWPRIGRHLP
jgi:hypothetical protein